jgi:site-specific DNA-methyltransferase (adenine-specific)
MDAWKNQLFFGDNLKILRENRIPVGSLDLIYLDPPFNSNATYNILFAEKSGEKSAAQITAFEDTWHWGAEAAAAFDEVVRGDRPKLADLLLALRAFLGQNDMMAYLSMMAVRLVELHRVLKPTGSLYLHCDPTASHYLKLILDAIFGPKNFRNEIVWKRTSARSDSRRWNRINDVIFFYTKSDKFTWNKQYIEYDKEYLDKFYRFVEPGTGRRYASDNLTADGTRRGSSGETWRGINVREKGLHWKYTIEKLEELDKQERIIWPQKKDGVPRYKRYLDEMPGLAIQTIITDIPPLSAQSAEKLNYPTQKPEALLERIIKASSNEGELVLDPFCGCGTTISVAERLKRRWIGIDITHLAITLIKNRLHDTFGEELAPYEVIGEPADALSAAALAEENRHQFGWWALGMVEAAPAQDKKKGADRGVDGVLYFQEKDDGPYYKIIVQVKSGHIGAKEVRELEGTRKQENAEIAALLTLKSPTKPMKEAVPADYFVSGLEPYPRFPRLQILTIAELFAGKQLDYPRWVPPKTFKKAARQYKGPTPQELEKAYPKLPNSDSSE